MCEVMPPCTPACPQMCSAPPGYSAGVPMKCLVDTIGSNPSRPGACCCGQPRCCTKPSCCYAQPPRPKSYKPATTYRRPTAPVESCTIYRGSYPGVDPCVAKMARALPISPKNNIFRTDAKMENCTIQKLSYPPNCGIPATKPIKPPEYKLLGCGPMQSVTTQKHDYVPKPICVRSPMVQGSHMQKTTAPLDSCTINRLSYMPIDVTCFPPARPYVHGFNIPRANAPAEKCTVYKLSYLPSCTGPREIPPWARPVRTIPPPYQDLGTIYKYSYMPNCSTKRVLPVRPSTAIQLGVTGPIDKNTTYKLSYLCPGGAKPAPIMPKNVIQMPTGPMEQCTVYKLSYLANCNTGRTPPIKPPVNYQRSTCPMQTVTTQKHDFVPKPICRVGPVRRPEGITRPLAPLECLTVNRLSYLPNTCYQPPKPIRPDNGFRPIVGPPEVCTTYKLSYMPVCAGPKEPLPWAQKVTYQRPTGPMETCTVQKLSYMPPGQFMDKCCCSCNCKQSPAAMCFPKAAC